jgi:hypothetical protein
VRDQDSCPYKTAGKNAGLYGLILEGFLEKASEDKRL